MRYELVVDLRTDFLPLLLRARRRFCRWSGAPLGPHAVQRHLGVIRDLPLPAAEFSPMVWMDAAQRTRARDLLGRVGLANAEFFCGDYTRQLAAGLFDVVVSLHTMPAHLLPFLPSQEPESYRRGPDLFAVADDPALPHRRVAWALEAVGRLARKPGRAVLHERLVSVPKVLLFSLLAARAGLTVRASGDGRAMAAMFPLSRAAFICSACAFIAAARALNSSTPVTATSMFAFW